MEKIKHSEVVFRGQRIEGIAISVMKLDHSHSIVATLPEGHGMTTQSVLDLWKSNPRIIIMNGSETNITTTAEVMEYARDIGRKWGDLHEIFVWEDGVKLDGNTLYYFQAIHQESDVIPENVDAIRALMGTEDDWRVSVARTDAAIAIYNGI